VLDDQGSNQLFIREEVIQWVLRTSQSSVPIAELPSPSRLKSKNSSRPEAIPTSPSAVKPAGRQGSQSATETEAVATATGPNGKCFPQLAPNVAKRPKYRSSRAKVDQYIVAIATIRSN